MIWVIIFIPVCVWLIFSLLGELSMVTWSLVMLTCLIFWLIEFLQIRKDQGRSKSPLVIMGLLVVSLLVSLLV